jgi:hypothetical protein
MASGTGFEQIAVDIRKDTNDAGDCSIAGAQGQPRISAAANSDEFVIDIWRRIALTRSASNRSFNNQNRIGLHGRKRCACHQRRK